MMVRYYFLIASMIGFGSSALPEDVTTDTTGVQDAGTDLLEHVVDPEAAAEIYQNSCRACHGNNARGAASYPGLSDLEPDYITEKLEIYRSGEKIGPNSILMIQHAKKLSDEDIANLSVFVATAFD